ncbi:hypothetical protein [Haloarchaeobius sp. DFWS5]|uniref:hypothetical protein n=1 Tax=Haloarchaeobius sp. DFWS5 TaxID=3446114 RepID=UPI003EBCDE90
MGEFARAIQETLRDELRAARPTYDWSVEFPVNGTPVDVGGESETSDTLVACEVEIRRADPANNTVKLFRSLSEGVLDDYDRIVVCQAFTAYYDLASGGVSTKRENAEFVGHLAEDVFERVTFVPVEFAVDPPKRGGEWPEQWETAVTETASTVAALLENR